jgi:MFS family permease
MSDVAAGSFSSLMAHRSFARFWCGRVATVAAYQMQAVAVGWQIYELTNNPLDLGIVGLVQFVPVVGMALVIGQIVDRYDRRAVARTCQIIKALCAAGFALGTVGGWLNREAMFALLFVTGTARAFETPTMHALVTGLVPASMLPRAVAASASANQTAIICGPALGGFIYALGPAAVYWSVTAAFVVASVLISLIHADLRPLEKKPISLETVFAGFAYIRSRPVILGAISLDLFAMLLGGVTALLPIFARDILDTGPWGLGLLRSAPALGALAMTVLLARISLEHRVGHVLFASLAAFGLSILVFAVSRSLPLSMLALVVYGGSDAISVVIRHSLVQTRTPNEMLGRVLTVNSLCTGTSSTLGEFRAGLVAAGFGVVAAVVAGGIGALLVTVIWMRAFPELPRINSLVRDH